MRLTRHTVNRMSHSETSSTQGSGTHSVFACRVQNSACNPLSKCAATMKSLNPKAAASPLCLLPSLVSQSPGPRHLLRHHNSSGCLTCDVVPIKAGCIKGLDGWVQGLANLQQVLHILVHQPISTQHITDLQSHM